MKTTRAEIIEYLRGFGMSEETINRVLIARGLQPLEKQKQKKPLSSFARPSRYTWYNSVDDLLTSI